jgi:transcription initiation factor TFIIE subunit beta
MTSAIHSIPATLTAPQAAGLDARTNVLHAIQRLREKSPASIPSADLIAYVLPSHLRADPTRTSRFIHFLRHNDKVTYHPSTDSYTFRPTYPIFSAADLLSHLSAQPTALGLPVRDLKDGWPDCEPTLTQLEAAHRLLVTRNKKDNHAKMVWADDPTLHVPLDGEYRDLWNAVAVPDKHDDTVRALLNEGFKPAGEVSQTKVVKRGADGANKPRKIRRGAKITNTHMAGVLRDYSHMKPVAKSA